MDVLPRGVVVLSSMHAMCVERVACSRFHEIWVIASSVIMNTIVLLMMLMKMLMLCPVSNRQLACLSQHLAVTSQP